MTTSHTPGPWAGPLNTGLTKFEIQGGGKKIAVVESLPDAAHIVRCVNAHDDLVAALREMTDRFEALRELHKYGPSTLTVSARAALAKAGQAIYEATGSAS